jgi:uridine kinase
LLQKSSSIFVQTKSEKLNPDHKNTKKKILVEIHPRQIMLVEGFLVLYDERVRKFLTTSLYLDLDQETRWNRRVHFKDEGYKKRSWFLCIIHMLNPRNSMLTM